MTELEALTARLENVTDRLEALVPVELEENDGR